MTNTLSDRVAALDGPSSTKSEEPMSDELIQRLRQLELRITAGANEACGSAADRIEQLQRKLAEVREVMAEAYKTFREYAWLHRCKGTAEGDQKAERNDRMAEKLAAALAKMETGR